MKSAVIRAQGCRVGALVVTGPLVAGLLVACTGWMAANIWPSAQTTALVHWLAQIFVICVGVCGAVAVTGDPLIELHESTPTPFRMVQSVRAGLVTVSALLGTVVMFVPLHLLGVWPRDEGWISLAYPAGAVVIVAVVAVIAAAFAASVSATTIAVVAAWMFLTMLWDPYVVPLAAQRGLPVLVLAPFLVLAWRRLSDSERNISKVTSG